MRPEARLAPLLLCLAACAAPPAPGESRLKLSGTEVSGSLGYAVTTAAAREEVASVCREAGLSFGSLTLGRIEGGVRAVSARCV